VATCQKMLAASSWGAPVTTPLMQVLPSSGG
jgi:hypothetical protein